MNEAQTCIQVASDHILVEAKHAADYLATPKIPPIINELTAKPAYRSRNDHILVEAKHAADYLATPKIPPIINDEPRSLYTGRVATTYW